MAKKKHTMISHWGIKIKTTDRYDDTTIRMEKLKNNGNTRCCRGFRDQVTHDADGNVTWYNDSGRLLGSILSN